MIRNADQIHEAYRSRRTARGAVIASMERIARSYKNEVVVPLPEMDRAEQNYVSNNITTGIDSYGQRIASVMPQITCPAIKPRVESSRVKADTRRMAYYGWWEANRVGIKLRRRARWFVGYGASPVLIRPDFKRGIPMWDVRNPLTTFPAPTLDPDEIAPSDCVFAVKRTLRELRAMYPMQSVSIADEGCDLDRLFTVLEYSDEEQITSILVCGDEEFTSRRTSGRSTAVVLDTTPNRIGRCMAVIPGRVTLDGLGGQFDSLVGMAGMRAKLMALEIMAVQRGVFPDTYLVSRPGETARFINGPFDGASGMVNEIEGGEIHTVAINPGAATNGAIDRLERAERIQGGIPSDFQGESATNIRTARRGDAVQSSTVDFPIQEAQEMLAASLAEENRIAAQTAKSYFGGQAKSFQVNFGKAHGTVDYIPSRDFETDHNVVSYGATGTDVNNLNIELGQLVSTGLMSTDSARHLHPHIDDPEMEKDKIAGEALERAVMASIEQQASAGQLPVADIARINQLIVEQNLPPYKAILQTQEEAQKRQATPVAPDEPEAQPGLAAPGMGAEQPSIPPAPQALDNVTSILSKLRPAG